MSESIWVGELDGGMLVYDPAIQLPECPHLFLWDPIEAQMAKYIANDVRKKIKRAGELHDSDQCIAAYQQWYDSHAYAWLEEQKPYYEARRKSDTEKDEVQQQIKEKQRWARLTPEERHRERLNKLGVKYLGVRSAAEKSKRRRVARCYACKRSLDNSIDKECIVCNWIICRCGACGC